MGIFVKFFFPCLTIAILLIGYTNKGSDVVYGKAQSKAKNKASLQVVESYSLKNNLPNPTDIHTDEWKNIFYITGENGILYLTDLKGGVLKKSPQARGKFAGVYLLKDVIYVSEKAKSVVYIYSKDYFDLQMMAQVPLEKKYTNRGFTAITYNPSKKILTLITEKNPLLIYELDSETLQLKNIIDSAGSPIQSVTAATYFQKKIWILSGEAQAIFSVDPIRYQIIAKYLLPTSISNAQGLVFRGEFLYIVSSTQSMLYKLNAQSVL